MLVRSKRHVSARVGREEGRHVFGGDPTAYDEIIMEAVRGLNISYVIALTKSDKLSANKRALSRSHTIETLARYGLEAPVIVTSSVKKQGREEMLRWIGDVVGR